MSKYLFIGISLLVFSVLLPGNQGFPQEDKVVRSAIEVFKNYVHVPPGTEIKFLEKRESPITDFFSIKLLLVFPDREMPVIVYVDKKGEKVILGNLYINGENITQKEAGPSKPKKIDMVLLKMEKSPYIGNNKAKVVIIEFSNFQCPYCMDSWTRLTELMRRYPQDFKYIFKHFPFQPQGKTFELSELAAAAYEVSNDAFWVIHDFFFTKEGQELARLEKDTIKQKVEQLLKERGYDIQNFQTALKTGKAKEKVLEDMALANRFRLTSTPTKIVNGDIIVGLIHNNALERYLSK